MITQLLFTRDQAGNNTFSRPPSNTVYTTTLLENAAQSFVVPETDVPGSTYVMAIFSIDTGLRVFVSTSGTAAVPGASFVATTSELNPTVLTVNPGQTISCITPDVAAYITVSLYAVKQ